jgi:all-trans-8'-apo-beta-carotenal 15,15'-oxygenase
MPHPLDKTNLDTVSPYSTFSSGKFTAHSRILKEADGSLRMCCFSPEVDWASQTTNLAFREYNEDGVLVSDKAYSFGAAYFHDMIVTDKWYIVFDCPIKMDYYKTFVGYPFGLNSLGDTISEDTDKEPVFRLFPRRNDGPMVEVTAKGMHCFAYHHVNGFDVDEEGSKVIFDTCTWDVFSLYFKDIVEPDGVNHFPRTKLSRFELDIKTGIATHKVMDDRPCEYPTVAPKSTGVPYRCGSFDF